MSQAASLQSLEFDLVGPAAAPTWELWPPLQRQLRALPVEL